MTLILLDMLANALCLAMMLRVMGRRLHPLRVLTAALFGALAACSVRMLLFSRAQQALCWLPLAVAMAVAADGRFALRAPLILLACEGLLGGTVYALSSALGSTDGAWLLGACFALIVSSCAMRARRAAHDVCTVRIRITHGAYTVELEALVDSGNCLRDYLTHRPVIVLAQDIRRQLGLEGVPLRPIFADTAGGRQMMACFTPHSVCVVQDGQERKVCACAAFSPGLSRGTPALMPQSLATGDTDCDEWILNREGKAYGKAEG